MALPGTRFHTPGGASLTGVSFSSKHDRKNVQSMVISQERRRDAPRCYRLSPFGLVAPEHGPIRLRVEWSKNKPELQILVEKYV